MQTLRLKFEDELSNKFTRLKVVNDKEIIIYIEGEKDITELTNSLTSPKLHVVPRDYHIHVSAKDKKTFLSCITDLSEDKYTVYSTTPRFIAKVTLDSKTEYDKLLNLQTDLDIRIKTYVSKFQYKPAEPVQDRYPKGNGKGYVQNVTYVKGFGKGNYQQKGVGKGKGKY